LLAGYSVVEEIDPQLNIKLPAIITSINFFILVLD